MVQAGDLPREGAEEFFVAGSTAGKWLQQWEARGGAEAKPRGGSVSPLEVHATVILEVVRAQPDAAFVELLVVLKKRESAPAAVRCGGFSAVTASPSRRRAFAPANSSAGCGTRPPQMDSR